MTPYPVLLAGSLLLAAAFAAPAVADGPSRRPDGGFGLAQGPGDHDTDALIERLSAEVRANTAKLERSGWRAAPPPKVSGLIWPLGPVPGVGQEWHGVSNFVDLNPAYPNQLLDYNGGTRTYDTQAGYNHRGLDAFIWPFPWKLLDDGAVEIRAAAAGTLIGKADGNADRSCSMSAPDTPNYVAIRHADNTVAYYLHMKNGSVSTLAIGSTVTAGTVIGRVGSSGISTGPHLHFELRASSASGAATIEPHTGPSNSGPSLWASQRPYRDSAINRLSTHSAAPVAPACGGTTMTGTDTPNFKTDFLPGQQVIFLSAFRDQVKGQTAQYRVLRPDMTVFASWNFDLASQTGAPDAYNAAYWYWTYTLPANAPNGLWTFESTYQGVTKQHGFRVGNTTQAIPDMKGLIGAWFEPTTSGQGFELHWINGKTALLFFYGHHDNGQNFFLLGQRDAAWDFNQEVVFNMYATQGGRWNNFNPANITRPTWGTLRITFVDCEHAVAELVGLDGTKVMSLERLGRTVGLDCSG